MSEEIPFFINVRRLQRADSYFHIGRTPARLRKLLEEQRCANYDTTLASCTSTENLASVGFYGVKRFLSLDPDPRDEDSFRALITEEDDDLQFENTSSFALFWMTFKRIMVSIGEHFSFLQLSRNVSSSNDPERNAVPEIPAEGIYNILVDPAYSDPRIKQSKMVYGDVNYLIQKFRMDLNCGSVDVALFSVEFPTSQIKRFDTTDLQSYVVSPECGSFTWVENGKASAIFVSRSSADFFGNIMEWFRKILSDMALADSVMVGHPYYWHPSVRRRLSRVLRYLKRLYRNLAIKERERQKIFRSGTSITRMAVMCPTDISKIVINEQPSRNLLHTSSTFDKLNIMLDQLMKKWQDYQYNLKQSRADTVKSISSTWSENNPHSVNRDIMDGGNFLESVTFLDFHPDKRVSADSFPSPILSNKDDEIINNNLLAENAMFVNDKICTVELDTFKSSTSGFPIEDSWSSSPTGHLQDESSEVQCNIPNESST